MRAINHRQRKKELQQLHSKSRRGSRVFIVSLILVICVASYLLFVPRETQTPTASDPKKSAQINEKPKKGVLRTFTAQQFRDLYNNFAHPNTERISGNTPITGYDAADERLRKMAAARGYTIRSAPVTDTFRPVEPGMLLQERAVDPWTKMKEAAKKDGIDLGLSAAYRSAEEQKEIFLSRLQQAGAAPSGIASGRYDRQISLVFQTTALPGYSRHHSGYTVDITCKNNPYARFHATACFDWLSKNNYENTKKFGWIPSYPEGVGMQGPEPEAWEYVWVGTESVTQ